MRIVTKQLRQAVQSAVLIVVSVPSLLVAQQHGTYRVHQTQLWPELSDGGPIRLVAGDNGRVAVLLLRSHQVIVLDGTGRRETVFGASGNDPGEFRSLSAAGWLGDTLWILDRALWRVTTYVAGSQMAVRPAPSTNGGVRAPPPMPMLAVGGYHFFIAEGARDNALRTVMVQPPHPGVAVPIARLGPAPIPLSLRFDGGRVLTLPESPLSQHTLLAADPLGRWITVVHQAPRTDQLLVVRVRPNGDTIWSVTTSTQRTAFSGEVKRRMTDHFAASQSLVERAGSESRLRQAIEMATRDESTIPAASALITGPDGATWIRGTDVWQETVCWSVLDRDGLLMGLVAVPRSFDVLAAVGDVVWAAVIDARGRPVLSQFGLKPTGEGQRTPCSFGN